MSPKRGNFTWQNMAKSDLDGTIIRFKSDHFKYPDKVGAVVGSYLRRRYYVRLETGNCFIVSDPSEWQDTWKDKVRYQAIRHPLSGSPCAIAYFPEPDIDNKGIHEEASKAIHLA